MRHQAEVVQFQKKQETAFMCSACGADRGCDCNAPALKRLADLEERKERQRQQNRESMQRAREKEKQNQSPVEYTDRAETAAHRAEARCAAQWKRFTAQEERNAVDNILEAISSLSDEQRALLFETLKDSYQWT